MQDNRLDRISPYTRAVSGIKAYIWIFATIFILYLIVSPFVVLHGTSDTLTPATNPYDGDANVRFVMAALLVILFAAALFISFRRRMTAGKLVFIVILAGFVLRFGYMLYTPFFIRGHDVGNLKCCGHLAYMARLFTLEGLPESNWNQFYHPPLAQIAGALTAKIYALLTGVKDLDTIFEAARLVPCFASCALLVVSCRLFNEFGFSKRAKVIAVTAIAFHPTFILLSASINNDMLMIFFMMTAFLYTVRWYREPTYKNILLLALSIGCAMSTKFSGALIAFFTAAVFLIALRRKVKAADKGVLGLVGQFSAFALLCVPLGLWYHIRNLALFGQEIGYVAKMAPDSSLYVGNIPLAERFFTFSLPNMLRNVYCNPYDDFRLWEYVVRCALFGEFTFSAKHTFFAQIMIVSSLLLILLTLFAMVLFLIFDKKENRLAVVTLFSLWALLMASFIFFNLKYPFGCTMDFRYIVPTVVTGAAFLGLLSDKLKGMKAGKAFYAVLVAVLVVFCISSACFYIV
jgi:hypothetical protein